MVIEKDLKVTPEEFYEFMVDSVIAQVENTFQKTLKPEQVKAGYTHKVSHIIQKTGAKKTSRYTITRAVPNKEFATVHSSADYKTKTRYTLTPTDKGLHIVYEQTTTFTDPKADRKGFMKKVDDFFLRRKLAGSIKQVEKAIKKNR